MKNINRLLLFFVLSFTIFSCSPKDEKAGTTEIMQWQDGKDGAVSITFDDGTINQFRVALPILDSLGFPATFFIVTGDIPGSVNQPKFFGRPEKQIIRETATIPTNPENLLERTSLAAYAEYRGLGEYHTRAGDLYEDGKIEEACKLMDEAFAKVRNGSLKPPQRRERDPENQITWEEIKKFASRGHEFASHTVTHPKLAVLDEANLLYELEKSKEEINTQLGPEHTFSAECPYGTENERVMEYAYKIYPALRNRMPLPYLEELNRGNKMEPGTSIKDYVQWQRGPLTRVPMDMMKSWVDTVAAHQNIWLVLVFHGVDGIGWEPRTGEELKAYYGYIKSNENRLWVATFRDVSKYIRERMESVAETKEENGKLIVSLTNDLDPELMFDLPLTLKTYLPGKITSAKVKQGDINNEVKAVKDKSGNYIIYRAYPNQDPVEISLD